MIIRVTTDFGPDIVFATVEVNDSGDAVLDWSMDGRPMPVSKLSRKEHDQLCSLARAKK
jgi:hypothetical protein